MKKIFIVLALLLFVVTLSACEDADTRPVLSYAAWNLGTVEENNIERRLIQAYQDEHPDIRIEVIPRPTQINEDGEEHDVGWFDFFATRAATNNLPDVFQVADVTTWIVQGWLDDISDLVEDDEDFLLVPEDIRNDAKFDEFLFALPQAMYYYGFFINRTAYELIPGNKPVEYGIEFSDLMDAAKKNYSLDLLSGGTGVAGIDGVNALIEWLPAQYDDTLNWFAFNSETGYHLDSEAFALAMTEQRKYHSSDAQSRYPYVLDVIPAEDRLGQYGTTDPWSVGKQSIKWAASYNIRDWVGFTQNPNHALYENDIDFIGTPKIGDTHKVPVIMDHIALGRGGKNRDMAYDFAKYMSFGVDGFKKRLEIARNNPAAGAINFAPMAQDETLISEYFELYPTMTEYRKLVEEHQYFIQESLWKTTPGYWFSRANGAYDESNNIGGMINKVVEREISLSDIVENLNLAANNEWNRAKADLDSAIQRFRQDQANS